MREKERERKKEEIKKIVYYSEIELSKITRNVIPTIYTNFRTLI